MTWPVCPHCKFPLVGGRCEVCLQTRVNKQTREERDAWIKRAHELKDKHDRQSAYIRRLVRQLEEAGIEPLPSVEVEGAR